MRGRNTFLNLISAWAGQLIVLLGRFISRKIFVMVFPPEYLGISGLFTNILTVLSLADLGITVSMGYFLYEPLAQKNEKLIGQMMRYYKKIFTLIGSIILGMGLLITPFLEWFVNGESNIPNLKLIFMLYVLNSAVSYFNSYKVILISADQKKYIVDLYFNLSKLSVLVIDIAVMLLTKDYLAYYSVQIIGTVVVNVCLSFRANRMYPYITEKQEKISKSFRKKVKENSVALMYHKIGTVIVMGTDNLLISKMVGLVKVGLYSNYLLIITNVNTFINAIISSATASIGNYLVTESEENKNSLFGIVNLVTFWIYGFCGICYFILLNPFISIWLGKEYVLDMNIVFVISLNAYLEGIRKGPLTFKEAFGLFKQDKYKALLEATINFVVSIILAKKYGMIGVFAGTTISTVTTCLWVEPLILYKYGFKKNPVKYYLMMIFKTLLTFICGGTIYFITRNIPITFVGFMLRGIACLCGINMFFILIYHKTSSYSILKTKVIKKINSHQHAK